MRLAPHGGAAPNRPARNRRSLVFLAVLLSHVVIVQLAIFTTRQGYLSPGDLYGPLILVPIPDKALLVGQTAPQRRVAAPPRVRLSPAAAVKPDPAANNAITVPLDAPPPKIDWEHEAELAARSGVARDIKEHHYRDLSALSPAQQEWLRRNHMEPMTAEFPWDRRRRDNGNPLGVFWINEYCVIVVLIPFCRWGGRVDPNGDLFRHMETPADH